jgi:hypothetical protein
MADGAPATPKDNIVPGLTFELTCIADGAPADSFLSDENIGYKIHTQATNAYYVGQLGDEQRFEFTLRDTNGAPVKKTAAGRKRSSEPDLTKEGKKLHC